MLCDPSGHCLVAKIDLKKAVFGYKVNTVLCAQSDLPVFMLFTPAHPHDSQVGWFVILVAALLFCFSIQVVYVAYFTT